MSLIAPIDNIAIVRPKTGVWDIFQTLHSGGTTDATKTSDPHQELISYYFISDLANQDFSLSGPLPLKNILKNPSLQILRETNLRNIFCLSTQLPCDNQTLSLLQCHYLNVLALFVQQVRRNHWAITLPSSQQLVEGKWLGGPVIPV